MTTLTLLPGAPAAERDWSWVHAAPFRAQLHRILDETNLPWRALAGYAGVPDMVVRSLLGRPDRRVLRRLAPHYAARLLHLDARTIRWDLAAPGSPEWASLWISTLLASGWSVRRVAAASSLAPGAVLDLHQGRPTALTRRAELLLAAAVRAHDLELRPVGAPARAA